MGKRGAIYNKIVTPELLNQVDEENKDLIDDFLDYLASIDRSPQTILQYRNDLKIFFVWNLQYNKNKKFVDIEKREISRFQKYVINELGWASARTRRVKSCISSMSKFIENILDDEYEDFKSIVNKIPSPALEHTREKTVLSDEKVQEIMDYYVEQQKYEDACMVAIAAYSGMRKAELLQMKVSYFTDQYLYCNGSMWKTPKIRTKGKGVNGKQLNKFVLINAKKYIDLWIEERQKRGVDIDDLFVKKYQGKWIPRESADNFANRISEDFGIDFYWHCLRHFTVTNLASHNLPAEVIREFIGWDDVALISVYNDMDISESFGNYFNTDGVITQDKKQF